MNPQARHEHLLTEEVADELVVYDLTTNKAHLLNRTAALVWQHCDGHTTVQQIATRLHQQVGLPEDDGLVWLALDRLQRAGLLHQPLTGATQPPTISRRTLIQRLGLAGKVAVLVPVVQTTNAPTADTVASPSRKKCEPTRLFINSCATCENREPCEACCQGGFELCLKEEANTEAERRECGDRWGLCDQFCQGLPTTTTTTTRKTK